MNIEDSKKHEDTFLEDSFSHTEHNKTRYKRGTSATKSVINNTTYHARAPINSRRLSQNAKVTNKS